MSKKLKKPNTSNQGRQVKALETPELSDDDQPPIFSLQYLNKDYCISNCQDNEKVAFVNRLPIRREKAPTSRK